MPRFPRHKLMTDCLNVLVAGKLFDAGNIHLFAHSMGGYVTETAFQGQVDASRSITS